MRRNVAYKQAAAGIITVAMSDLILAKHIDAAWIIPLLTFLVLPGRLLLAALSAKRLSLLTTNLYSVGLGLALITALGFGLNALTIFSTHRETLNQTRVLVAVHLELLILAIVCYKRHCASGVSLQPVRRPIGFRPLDVLTTLLSLLTLLCGLGGVNVLNNGGSNSLVLVTLGMCALLPAYIIVARNKISVWSYGAVLFTISLNIVIFHIATEPLLSWLRRIK